MKWVVLASMPLLVALAVSCTKASESTEAKRTPKPPPGPASSEPSTTTAITVDVDGATSTPIDSAKLNATTPDFKDDEHRAWKLTSLLTNTARPGMAFAVTGEHDVTIVLRAPRVATDPIPALLLNRRGELFANMVDPADPFPAFHGQGGRLARPGDPTTRIGGVRKIRAYVELDSGSAAK